MEVQQAVSRVARHLPEAHFSLEFWRPLLFRWAVERFVQVVYALDVSQLSDADLQAVEELVLTGQRVIEVHTTLRAGREDLVYLTTIIRQLRDAVDGLQQGLPPDPAKRPSDDELMDRLARNLRAAGAA